MSDDRKVPLRRYNRRDGLSMKQLAEEPWLEEFVQKFADRFEYDPVVCIFFLKKEFA